MTPGRLLELLLETAPEFGLQVRRASRADLAPSDPLPRSGFCRVAGVPWVVLAPDEPAEVQIELLARALRESAGPELESRYLPPALRTVIAGSTGS